MSSRFRTDIAAAPLLALALSLSLSLSGCGDSRRTAPGGSGVPLQRDSALVPGGGDLDRQPNPAAAPYYDNADAVVEGMRLYNQMNCVGCHFNGGGGIGPPLMDNKWTYGGRLDQIFDTIYFGRAHGMPAWGGKLTEDQIWKIAAYVRSMSLPETLEQNGQGTPSQHPMPVPRASDAFDGWHVPKDKGD